MMWPRSSISARIGLERSGIAPIATEKNTAKITICRISFCAIASAIEVGIRWVRNFSIENADTGNPVDCALSGRVPGKFAPGCKRLTMTRPSSKETNDALTNQPMVFAKIRPSLAASHMGDAADQGGEYQRRDDHLDQAQEQHRDQVYVGCDLHPAVGEIVEDQRPHHDAKRHRDQNVLRKPVGHFSYPRKFRQP